jgi:two-component system, chemotaxis family, protein-glutamate methylesterase/glutaminase
VPGFDIVAFASSAGGLKALTRVLGALPADFQAAIVLVQHVDRHHPSLMAGILAKRIALKVHEAIAGERLAAGTVYIAPPDKHLLVNAGGTLELTQTELVHFVRPSADLLFESTAAAYRERAIAVVLSGTGVDGALGVTAIHKMGGKVIVQDAQTAEFSGMPQAAQRTGVADFVLALDAIAPALHALVHG